MNAADLTMGKRARGTSSRMMLVGICAWISLCLLIAGWLPEISTTVSSIWLISGLMGLVSSVGLAETIKADMRTQDMVLTKYMQAAMTDGLTGLANRQALDQIVESLLEDLRAHGRSLSLTMLDIDHFKKFNDQWGHQAGDAVLRDMSHRMEEFFRERGYVARYGGEEFAVVLPNCRLEDAEKLAEAFRCTVKQTTCEFRDKTFQVTISAGVTEACPDEALDALLRRADMALYAAKKMGRDCIWVANPNIDNTSSLEAAAAIISSAVTPEPAPKVSTKLTPAC